MSLRLRVKMRTSSPERCTWTRAPSSFHSTDARPVWPRASATSAALAASIGWIGWSTARCTAVERVGPVVQREGGGPPEVAGEHGGAPHDVERHLGGLGHRVGHHAGQRALAQPAGQQLPDERRPRPRWPGRTGRPSSSWRAATDPAPDVPASSAEHARPARAPSIDGSGADDDVVP